MSKPTFQINGRVGRLEVKELNKDSFVLLFSLACDVNVKNKAGDYVNETNWYNLAYFTNKPQSLSKIIASGNLLSVSGQIEQKKINGDTRYSFLAKDISVLVFKKTDAPKKEAKANNDEDVIFQEPKEETLENENNDVSTPESYADEEAPF